jgi:multiple sugar transport system substrate-binding protein
VYGVPFAVQTAQILYNKKIFADQGLSAPKTWAEMIADAEKLAKQGKPHYIEIQGAQYEGTVVWFNSLLQSAGGSVLNAGSTRPALGPPAVKALSIMKQLAASPAADPSLSVQMEDANRLAMEAGTAAFELNYPFVWPSMQTDKPSFYKAFKYAPYPGVDASTPAKVTIGGIDLAISKYSLHPNLAFQAALCLRDRQNQKTKAIKGGLPPTLASLYSDPAMQGPYPFRKLILASLQNAAVRPKTPAYQVVSVALSHLLSPPANIVPTSIEQTMKAQVNDALQGKGLTP